MRKLGLGVACAALLLMTWSQPALADEIFAVTPSRATEAFFNIPVVDTSDRLVNGCIDMGWNVVSSTSAVVVCEAHLGTLEAALSQLLIGNQYSTPPKTFVRFNLAGLRQSTRVQANAWIETQMAFGQTRTEEMISADYHNDVMGLFSALGVAIRQAPNTRTM